MTLQDNLLYIREGIQFLAVTHDNDDGDDGDDDVVEFLPTAFITQNNANNNNNKSLITRRRSSVRSKLSFHEPKDSEQVQIYNYSSDLSKRELNDFEMIKILGIGSYGKVYLVKDIYTKKLFAKKTIKKAKISLDKNLLKTQKNEKEILSNISHPNIVKLFYSFHDNDNINFILEYIPGGEIFYHLSNKIRFNEDDTAFYLAEISLAINHLHKLGIVYRDLKPENVMLNSNGHIVLTDFGLSSMEETCHSILGTPQFTAPEVIKGESYSYPADWWSFGIMTYDLLIGKTPFDGNSKNDIFSKILKKKIDIPNYLSLYAKDLLNKLLNRDPIKRFKIDNDFKKFQQHRFFRKIDWNNIENSIPPFIPIIDDPINANNFDQNYINEILEKEKSSNNDNDSPFDDQMFKGFSFTASESILESHFK